MLSKKCGYVYFYSDFLDIFLHTSKNRNGVMDRPHGNSLIFKGVHVKSVWLYQDVFMTLQMVSSLPFPHVMLGLLLLANTEV